jgi:hypothetical protein
MRGFCSTDIIVVPAGTVIKHGEKELEVTESSAVFKGRAMYVTEKTAEAIKRAVPKSPA